MTAPQLALSAEERAVVARRGTLLSRVTLAYNAAEGIVVIGAGVLAGSIALDRSRVEPRLVLAVEARTDVSFHVERRLVSRAGGIHRQSPR